MGSSMIATSTRCLTSRCPIKEGRRVPPFGASTASRASPGGVSPPAVIASAARLAPVQAAEEPSHKSGQRELAQHALAQYAARARLRIEALSGVIHPYPTQAEAIKRLGDASLQARLKP